VGLIPDSSLQLLPVYHTVAPQSQETRSVYSLIDVCGIKSGFNTFVVEREGV
jgi:hypothetical protein